jgi:putative tricarboxylic transport membrane protein
MGIARDRDVISGAALAALGVFILSQALQWNFIGPDGPGPGFFPVGYGALMIALSLYLVVKSALKPDATARSAIEWSGVGRALATWSMFTGSIALMEPLGFPVAFALLAAGTIWLVMGKPLWIALVTAVLSAACFWLVFSLALGLNLPAGYAWPPVLRTLGTG